MKNYTADNYKEVLKQVDFPNYKCFGDVNGTYSDLLQKLVTVINKIAPYNSKGLKAITQKWFDGEVLEKINLRNKRSKKFKKSRLHIDKKWKYDALKPIGSKKKRKKKKKTSIF